jgi:transcriptional regulator with XRE-family HTH domain
MTLRIRLLRRSRGLSQARLAALAGLSRSQLSEIESEAKPANTRRLQAIAAALGVGVEQLFEPVAEKAQAEEILDLIRQMSSEDRASFLRIARALAGQD